MSRATRRHPAAAPKERPQKRASFGTRGPQQTRGVKQPQGQKRRRFGKPGWLEDIVSELKKVNWPTRDDTSYLTMVVIIVAITVGVFLGGIDIFLNWLIDKLLLR